MLSWIWNCMLFWHFYRNLMHQVLFLYMLPSHHSDLRGHPWRYTYLNTWCRTDIWNWKLSVKVSLMLVNSFPAPRNCKLEQVSIYFIQSSMKTACNWLIPFRKWRAFQRNPWCFGNLAKFQDKIEICFKTARVSSLSFHFLWLCSRFIPKYVLKHVIEYT